MYISNIFCEVKYETSFLFDDGRTRNELQKNLKNDFPHFNYDDSKKSLVFLSENLKARVLIFNNRIFIDIKEPSEVSEINTLGSSIIPQVLRLFDRESTERIGVRAYFVRKDIEGFDAISKLILNSFFNNRVINFIDSFEHNSLINPSVGFSVDLSHELSMNVNTAIHQIGSGIANDTGQIIEKTVDNVYPVLDLDIYTINPKQPQQINGVLKGICEKLSLYSKKIWELEE